MAKTGEVVSVPRSVGMPRKFPTVQALIDTANQYIDECKSTGVPFTIAGLRASAHISPTTWAKYKSGKYGEDYAEVASMVKDVSLKNVLEQGLLGNYSAGVVAMILKYDHTYNDKALDQPEEADRHTHIEFIELRGVNPSKAVQDMEGLLQASGVEQLSEDQKVKITEVING